MLQKVRSSDSAAVPQALLVGKSAGTGNKSCVFKDIAGRLPQQLREEYFNQMPSKLGSVAAMKRLCERASFRTPTQ
eukprot:5013160-Amphidinium_carterae.1